MLSELSSKSHIKSPVLSPSPSSVNTSHFTKLEKVIEKLMFSLMFPKFCGVQFDDVVSYSSFLNTKRSYNMCSAFPMALAARDNAIRFCG